MGDDTQKKAPSAEEQVATLTEKVKKLESKIKKKDAYAKGLKTQLNKAEATLARKSKLVQR
jgi:multidrug resistance efflux pump